MSVTSRSQDVSPETQKTAPTARLSYCGSALIVAQSLTKSGRETGEDEAPNRFCDHEHKSQCDKRSHFHIRRRIDELRQKSEKKQRNFRIENVCQNSLLNQQKFGP
jgi:hypothetical protein